MMNNNNHDKQTNLVNKRITRNSKRRLANELNKKNTDCNNVSDKNINDKHNDIQPIDDDNNLTNSMIDRKRKCKYQEDDLNKIKKDVNRNSKKIKQLEDNLNLYDYDELEDNIDTLYEKVESFDNKLIQYKEKVDDLSNNLEYIMSYIDEEEEDEYDDEGSDENGVTNIMEEQIVNTALKKISPLIYCKKRLEKNGVVGDKLDKELKIITEFLEIMNSNGNSQKFNMLLDYFIDLNTKQKNNYIKKIKGINSKKQTKPIYFRILDSDLSDDIKNTILTKYEISCSNEYSSEYAKFNNWVNSLFSIPWGKKANLKITANNGIYKISKFLSDARLNMDRVIYGQNDTKDHIIQIISKMISNPKKTGNVFAIYGPPGTGKTTIIKEGMSKALGIPFTFISLGGATDSSFLEGHSYTYEGSEYGKIVESLKVCKVMNPIFYFDELDKVSQTTKGEEIINSLIHLTDSSQNTLFQDKYFGSIPFDLSNSIFVFSFNDLSKINKILLDRMELINVNGFDLKEKMNIAKNYLLPELLNNYNIMDNQIIFNDDIINYIVNFNSCGSEEKGVRNIKRRLENIISKLNILILTKEKSEKLHTKLDKVCKNRQIVFPLELTRDIVDILINDGVKDTPPPFGMYS
jgi:hypothetical protein